MGKKTKTQQETPTSKKNSSKETTQFKEEIIKHDPFAHAEENFRQ